MAIDEAYDKLLVIMKGGLVEVKVKRKGRAAMVYKRGRLPMGRRGSS